MNELMYASATALAQAIRHKTLSSLELVTVYIQRLEAVNPQLNAVVQLTLVRGCGAGNSAAH